MTTQITFNAVDLTADGSMVNFPNGYPKVLDSIAVVYDSNARDYPIIVTDSENSVPFTGTWTIFGASSSSVRTKYDAIKALQATVGDLVITKDTVQVAGVSVLLRQVSLPSFRGSVATCTLDFVLVA